MKKKFHATSFQWFYKQKFVLQTLHKNVVGKKTRSGEEIIFVFSETDLAWLKLSLLVVQSDLNTDKM